MSIREPRPAFAVQLLQTTFAEQGAPIATGQVYNLYARLRGYKNWAHFKRDNPVQDGAEPYLGTDAELVRGWPTWVVFEDLDGCADTEGRLLVLPYGSTIGNRRRRGGVLRTDGALELEFGLPDARGGLVPLTDANRKDHLVLWEVHSIVPSVSKYGLPTYANDREVATWAENDMGWGYRTTDSHSASAVDVSMDESGDDGMARFWAVLKVSPAVHAGLVEQLTQAGQQWRAVVPLQPLPAPLQQDPLATAVLQAAQSPSLARLNPDSIGLGQWMEDWCAAVLTGKNSTTLDAQLFAAAAAKLAELVGSIDALGLPLDDAPSYSATERNLLACIRMLLQSSGGDRQ